MISLGDQPLPHSYDMEKAVLSCIIQDPVCAMVVESLPEEAFHIPQLRRVYKAMQTNYKTCQMDMLTLGDTLEREGVLDEVGGMAILRELYSAVPTVVNFDKYLESVKEHYHRRKMIMEMSESVGSCYDTSLDFQDIVAEHQKHANEPMDLLDKEEPSMSSYTDTAMESMRKTYNSDPSEIGISSGFMNLDRIIMGLRKEDYIILAARPSIGKTALAVSIGMNVAHFQHHVLFYSLEMNSNLLVQRMMACAAMVSRTDLWHKIRSWEEFEQELLKGKEILDRMPFHLDDHICKWEEVRHRIRAKCHKYPIELIEIDYMQLLHTQQKFRCREEELAYISGDIKNLARELEIPIMALAQLNRVAEDSRPQLSNLRESGAIEQDADIVALLHRKRPINDRESADLVHQGLPLPTDLAIAKNRNGMTGMCKLQFHEKYTLFEDQPRIDPKDYPQV